MKRFAILCFSVLLLSSCTSTGSQTFDVDIRTDNPEVVAELHTAMRRVVERRLFRYDADVSDYSVEGDTVTIAATSAEAMEILTQEISQPINFEIAYQVPEGEETEGDYQVEGHGTFRSTDVTGEDVEWVEGAVDDENLNTGRVAIGFTPTGVAEMQQLFTEYEGQNLAIFIRGQLAAKITLQGAEIEQFITINGIPSVELAKVFADDVNTGIYMTFTPVQ